MKPLRCERKCEVTKDPATGRDRVLNLTEKEHVRSDQGSVDTTEVHRKYFLDCGCESDACGRCYECGAISCKACHGRCNSCQKPICLEHSNISQVEGEDRIRLCTRCHGTITRKQRLARFGRFLLSLFLVEESSDD